MSQQSINCPHCGRKIEITEMITHEIEGELRNKFQEDLKKKEAAFLEQLKAKDEEMESKVFIERKKASESAKKEAEGAVAIELADLKAQLEEERKKREIAQKEELSLRKRQRELEESKRNFELEMTRKLDEERNKIEETSKQRVLEEYRFKDAEKDKKLADALKQMDELKRRIEQGSQQTQGEIMQLELDNLLSSQFPQDKISQIAKGVAGADILQEVYTQNGRYCGKILWETKRTKNWQDKWLEKLRDDQRAAKADVAAIVTEALPKDVKGFRLFADVWVIEFQYAIFLATTLRAQVIHLSTYKDALVGKGQKEEALYGYMTGQPYRDRMSAMVESHLSMLIKLAKERASAEKGFSERENDLKKSLANLAGMHGDLASIIGPALPTVKNLELPYETETVEEETHEEVPF